MDGLYYIIVLEWFTVTYKKTTFGPQTTKDWLIQDVMAPSSLCKQVEHGLVACSNLLKCSNERLMHVVFPLQF